MEVEVVAAPEMEVEIDASPDLEIEIEADVVAPEVEFEVEAPQYEVELEVPAPDLALEVDLNAPVVEVEAGGATVVTSKGGCSACSLIVWGIICYLVAAGCHGFAFWDVYSRQQSTGVTSYSTLSVIMTITGSVFGLVGLIFLIASCVKCCCTDKQEVVVNAPVYGVDYQVGGAVGGEVEVDLGSDANLVGTMDVELPRADIEVDVELDAPALEVEVDAGVEVELEVEAPALEVE